MTIFASAIVRHAFDAIHNAKKRPGGLRGICQDAGVCYAGLKQWRNRGADPKISNVEALLNAAGYTLVILPLDDVRREP